MVLELDVNMNGIDYDSLSFWQYQNGTVIAFAELPDYKGVDAFAGRTDIVQIGKKEYLDYIKGDKKAKK